MLLKKEYRGTRNVNDIVDFWSRDLSIEQCAQETGLDVAVVIEYYERYSKEFYEWCSKEFCEWFSKEFYEWGSEN